MNTKISNNVLILMLISSILQQTAFALPKENVLKPYDGPSVPGVDPNTLTGKVMTGYQGWFNCEGDGANLGWTHWARDRNKAFGPGNVTVDLWPDVSEYDDDELYATAFTYEDGTPAKTFSSHNRKTVIRHFRWMGANMLYIAMFDEVDEGTAVFKCTNDPPNICGSKFLSLDGLPSDFYLRLAGQAGKLLRGEIPLTETVPIKKDAPRR